MSKCSCYHTTEVRNYTYHPITGAPIPHDQTVGVCNGTKEMDECSCGGDESKCDFYPEKRKETKKPRLYAVRDLETGKLVSDITNPRRKYWDKRGNAEAAIRDYSPRSRNKGKHGKLELVIFDLVEVQGES